MILIIIILLLVLFGIATSDGIGKGDVDGNGLANVAVNVATFGSGIDVTTLVANNFAFIA